MTYYRIFNRIFQTRADAVNYCISCDFDENFIEEVIE